MSTRIECAGENAGLCHLCQHNGGCAMQRFTQPDPLQAQREAVREGEEEVGSAWVPGDSPCLFGGKCEKPCVCTPITATRERTQTRFEVTDAGREALDPPHVCERNSDYSYKCDCGKLLEWDAPSPTQRARATQARAESVKNGLAFAAALKSDPVNHPSHYTAGRVEAIDAIESALGEQFEGYCKGQVFKYLWRAGLKADALEDARKAQWYLNRLIQTVERAV